MEKNIFTYWSGPKFKLLKLLEQLMITNSKLFNYKLHILDEKSINDYFKVPSRFYELSLNHQSDVVRTNVINDYGGIWLDFDTLIIENLDYYFSLIEKYGSFFLIQDEVIITSAFFGAEKGNYFVKEWKRIQDDVLLNNKIIEWSDLGPNPVTEVVKFDKNIKLTKDDLEIIINNEKTVLCNGLHNIYPICWYNSVDEYLKKPYDNYKIIEKPFQPIISLVNSVYREYENYDKNDIVKTPLYYFLSKAFKNNNLELEL